MHSASGDEAPGHSVQPSTNLDKTSDRSTIPLEDVNQKGDRFNPGNTSWSPHQEYPTSLENENYVGPTYEEDKYSHNQFIPDKSQIPFTQCHKPVSRAFSSTELCSLMVKGYVGWQQCVRNAGPDQSKGVRLQRCLSFELLPNFKLGIVKRARFRSITCALERQTFHKFPDLHSPSFHHFEPAFFENKNVRQLNWKLRLMKKGKAWKAKFKNAQCSWSCTRLDPQHSPRPPECL